MQVLQQSLRGVWRQPYGCPHRHGYPEGPDRCEERCEEGSMSVCGYELGNGFRCEVFAEILEERKKEDLMRY